MVNSALNICAPVKKFTIKLYYRQGLSEKVRALMTERDRARQELKNNPMEKMALLKKYKKLRNETTKRIREDTKTSNGERINFKTIAI